MNVRTSAFVSCSEAICTDILRFPARVLVIQAAKGCSRAATLTPDTVLRIGWRDVRSRGSPAFAARRTGP